LALAAILVWLGHHRAIRPQGLFALYVAGYSGYRIFEETIRIDSSAYFLGLRLNFFVALVMTVVGLTWFCIVQFRGSPAPVPAGTGTESTGTESTGPDGSDEPAGTAAAGPDRTSAEPTS
jgi:prolipoprotein diacylglyceryltransferase